MSVFCLNVINAEITWTLSDDGTLTVSGGDMPDYYGPDDSPWYSKRDKIKKIVIENGVTRIGNYAFCECNSLTSVTISNSVTSIGECAFHSCRGLSSINISNSLTSIGVGAFENCYSLTSITIPNSVTSIKCSAFAGCSSLTSISIPNSVTSIGNTAFSRCSSLTSITIPNSVTSIELRTFSECSNLASVYIPNSVTSIGQEAFSSCYALTSITIPNSVTSIGGGAFYWCKSLTTITIPNSVTSIEDGLFSCSGLTSITIPESVTSIGGGAFENCSSLTSITIPETVTSIGAQAFLNCRKLTSIPIPKSVTSIETKVFQGCSRLTSITIPNSVKSIGYCAFHDCSSLSSITIPNSVTRIGDLAFRYCSNLTTIIIPSSVTKIGKEAFLGCTNLASITVEKENVKYDSRGNCNAVVETESNTLIIGCMNTVIPNSVMNIGELAFGNCTSLTSIAIPKSVTNIEFGAFSDCSGLTSIICEASTPSNCGDNSFYEVNKSIPVYVPYNSVDAYKNAKEWKDFTNIQAVIDNQSIANAVIEKIDAIGKVEYTYACKDKIDEANNAYNALTADQKALVTNLDVLTTAKQTYDNLKAAADKLAADKAKADVVIAKINAIGTIEYTDACKSKIDAASKAYEALTDNQKALVTNLDVLTTAKQTYETLKATAEKLAADKAAANKVINKIKAIGTVEYTDACKSKIDAASKAYEALTADQKALVSNLDVLTIAKQTYDNLKVAAEKLAADKAAFDKYKTEIKAIIEALVKEDDSDAVKDIIKKAISDIDALGYEEAISLDDNKVNINSFVTSVNEAVEKQRAEDQKTNGIEELEFADKYNIYDLNGRKITNSVFKSGLYIRNGKKVVVK